MKINIVQLNEAELIDLNNRVVARLKFLSQMRAHAYMLDFNIVKDRFVQFILGRSQVTI